MSVGHISVLYFITSILKKKKENENVPNNNWPTNLIWRGPSMPPPPATFSLGAMPHALPPFPTPVL